MGAGESVRIPSRLLLGIVPEVLLRSFQFWQYQVRYDALDNLTSSPITTLALHCTA